MTWTLAVYILGVAFGLFFLRPLWLNTEQHIAAVILWPLTFFVIWYVAIRKLIRRGLR